jgi:adenosylcobinamide-GDP ribazoletransferase
VGLMGPGTALWVLGAGAVGAGAVAWLARAKIGGQTGDVLGASQQISEMCIMLSLSAVLAA